MVFDYEVTYKIPFNFYWEWFEFWNSLAEDKFSMIHMTHFTNCQNNKDILRTATCSSFDAIRETKNRGHA